MTENEKIEERKFEKYKRNLNQKLVRVIIGRNYT